MSIKAKTEWIGDDMLTLQVSCMTAADLIRRCRANAEGDATLEAELKAAIRQAAQEKAEKLSNYFS